MTRYAQGHNIGETLVKLLPGLGNAEASVVLFFTAQYIAQGNEWIAVNQDQLKEATGLCMRTVFNSLSRLRTIGLIEQKAPYHSLYRLNTSYTRTRKASVRNVHRRKRKPRALTQCKSGTN